MINSELEEIIYIIGDTIQDNIIFHSFVDEEARKLEHHNGISSLFSIILTRLARQERSKHKEEFYHGLRKTKEKRIDRTDIIIALRKIKKINLREKVNKELLEKLIKKINREYDVNQFIIILEIIENKFFDILKEGKIEFFTKKELIEEDSFIETIKSVVIVQNLYRNDYDFFKRLLKEAWWFAFLPGEEKPNLQDDLNAVFINALNEVIKICQELLIEGNFPEKLIPNLQEVENEKIHETYFFAFQTIVKNFRTHTDNTPLIHEDSIIQKIEDYIYHKHYENEAEKEFGEKRLKMLMNRYYENIILSLNYSSAYDSFITFLRYKERFCEKSDNILNALIHKVEIINNYINKNPNLMILDDKLKGIMFAKYNSNIYKSLELIIYSLNSSLTRLKKAEKINTLPVQGQVTKEEVQEAIKFVINNYMADEIFYKELIELREIYYCYGFNISRFCLALSELSKAIELYDTREQTQTKRLKKLNNKERGCNI